MRTFLSYLVLFLVFVFSAVVPATSHAGPAGGYDSLAQEFERRGAALRIHDANGHYQLGLDMYRRFGGKVKGEESLEPLKYAERELGIAAGIFKVQLEGETELIYSVAEDAATWEQIGSVHGAGLEDLYRLLHANHKDRDKRDKVWTAFSQEDRNEVLAKAASQWRKGKGGLPVVAVHEDARGIHELVSTELKAAQKRMAPDFWAMAFSVIGGLGIFLIGMKNMSDGTQAVAGRRMRRMINAVTDNPVLAVGVGTAITMVVQSSSITTVIVVGLVNSGLMALHQAIGVIMGANIGTTITGWILALNIGKYGLPIIGISVLFYLFSKKDSWRYLAMAAMGLGMIFLGLEMMKNGFKPMKGVPEFEAAFSYFDATTYLGVLKLAGVGCLLTFIVQSSSATLGITIGLAMTGAIPYEAAGALVLGENIGTTITAWLASIGATTNAKRAAYAHVLFNLVGVFWVTLIYSWLYVDLIGSIVESSMGVNPVGLDYDSFANKGQYAAVIAVAIAATHTIFNVVNTLLFMPFARILARLLERVIPDKDAKEVPHLTSLDFRMVESAVLGIENSRGEILKMGRGVDKMMGWTLELIQKRKPDEELIQRVMNREEVMDNVQHEIVVFLTELLTGEAPHSVTVEGRQQLRISDEYESVSDYISNVLKANLRIRKHGLEFTDAELAGIVALHQVIQEYMSLVNRVVKSGEAELLTKALTQGRSITRQAKDLRDAHLARLSTEDVHPIKSMSLLAMINGYRKIKDHLLNIAEAVAEN